jgi:tetratricopeptide (TPR) repeat protein
MTGTANPPRPKGRKTGRVLPPVLTSSGWPRTAPGGSTKPMTFTASPWRSASGSTTSGPCSPPTISAACWPSTGTSPTGFYLQALAIAEKLGDQNNIATDFHQLGVLAQHREQLEEADDWFTKSLAIRNQLGDELGAATSYHHLGAVAQLRGQFDRAEEWYTKSLAIKEKVGAPLSLAPTLAHCMNRAVSTSVAALRAAVSRVRQV